MANGTGKGGSRNAGAPGRGAPVARRNRVAAAKPAAGAGVPVLPEPVDPPEVPAILAAPEPQAPAPVVTAVAAGDDAVVDGPAVPAESAAPDAPVAIDAPDAADEAAENAEPADVAPPAEVAQPIIQPAAPAASLATKEVEMNETVTSFAEKAQEQTKAAFSTAGEQTRTAVEKGRKVAEDLAEFGKGNVEALVESARIAAQGFESLGQDAAAFARARYDSTAAVFQTLASVKSPTELLQIQADYVRSSFDALVKEASRSTEASLKLAGDVAKPLQNRLAVAADKFRTAA